MKLLKTLILTTLVFGLVSCDVLDNPTPQQSLNADEVLNNPEGLVNLVTGMYDGIQSAAIAAGQYNYTAELLGDNITWSGSFATFQNIAQRNLQPNNGNFGAWWNTSYREINTANILLQNVEVVEGPNFTDDDKDLIRGEAHFARGMLYFQMAYVFARPFWDDQNAPAVPIRTTPVTDLDDFENLERNTLSEVLIQAEQDLIAASNLLPDTRLRSDRRATRYAALTYLMRLELVREDYEAAADYAQTIMDAGFSLTDTPGEPFENEHSSESIFEIVNTQQDNPGANGGVNAFYTPTNRGGRGDIQVADAFVAALDEIVTDDQQAAIDAAGWSVRDLRRDLLVGLGTTNSATLKYPNGANRDDNVMNSRYAEVLLSRAEALVEDAVDLATVPQESYDLLNQIRARSLVVTNADGLPQSPALIEYSAADFNDKQELIDAIILERRVELAFEGDRFYTLKRKALPVTTGAGTFETNDPCMIFPIPQGEMDANPNMVQNPNCG